MRARVSQLSLFTRVFLHCEILWFSLCLSTSPCGGSFKRTCQRSVKFWTCFQCPCPWRTRCYWCGKLSGRGSIFFDGKGKVSREVFVLLRKGVQGPFLYHTIWFCTIPYDFIILNAPGIRNPKPRPVYPDMLSLARLVRSPVLCCYVFRYSTILINDGRLRFSLLCTHVQMINPTILLIFIHLIFKAVIEGC